MSDKLQTISLGFTRQEFPPGVHVCQIFSNDDERQESLLKFILSGLQAGERTCCFSDQISKEAVGEFLGHYGISLSESLNTGTLTLAGTKPTYFQDNRFDPDRMLGMLAQYQEDSVAKGFTAARLIGEMSPEIQQIEGGNRLLEYESRVSLLLRDHPVTTVCQYDARCFDGAVIMDILKVHPFMVIRGSVVRNPFFMSPEEFLPHQPDENGVRIHG